MSARKDPSSPCCFCNLTEDNELKYGKFYEHDGIVTHYYCLLLSSNMEQKGKKDEDGILGFLVKDIQKEIQRGRRLVCSYCRKSGATLGCCNVRCRRIFHLPCGLGANSLHQFYGQFKSFCVAHSPKQKIDSHILKEITSLDNILCCICYEEVNPSDSSTTLWAPCCKKDKWFHRICVQQLALNAGYFFKCPLCNNKREFQRAMLEYGIFIPQQDASWELVPHAFEELLYRYNRCDAVKCLCPKGRRYTSSNAKWELTLCRICGSQGIHMACGQLKWVNPVWECVECTSILTKNGETADSDSISESSSHSKSSVDSDSDTDISVGIECPLGQYGSAEFSLTTSSPTSSEVELDSEIKLPPGPRCFKLRHIRAKKMVDSSELTDATPESDVINLDNTTCKRSHHINNNYEKGEINKKNVSQRAKQSSNGGKPASKDADVITIETDDDDDNEVEIISLKQKTRSPIAPTLGISRIQLSKDTTKSPENPVASESATSVGLSTADSNGSLMSILESIWEIAGKSNPTTLKFPEAPQVSTPDVISLNDDSEGASVVDTHEIPVMNIKISHVTSLPPEVFDSVPDVACDAVTFHVDSANSPSSLASETSERIVSPSKRNMQEENNEVDKCKKIKKNNFDNRLWMKNCPNVIACETITQQNGISTTAETQNNDGSNCMSASTQGVSNLSLNNNLPAQAPSFHVADIQNHEIFCESTSDSNPASNQDTRINGVVYAVPNFLSQVINNTNNHGQPYIILNNNQQTIVSQSTVVSVTAPIAETENRTGVLDKQEAGRVKEKIPVSNPDNNSPTNTFCDGNAGGPAKTGRRNCTETKREPSKSWSANIDNATCSKNPAAIRSIFPEVTNNLNTCHQPRLIPQYVDLCDLKFRVLESDPRNFQMVLYDAFSVNIPVDNPKKRRIRLAGVVAREPKRSLASRPRGEASSSLDYVDGTSTAEQCVDRFFRLALNESHLINDKVKCATRVGHDDAKENLDPVKSRTLSRRFGNVSLASDVDDAVIKSDCAGDENDGEMRLSSSDTNLSAFSQTICNTGADNIGETIPSDCNQTLRVNSQDAKQHRQASSAEEWVGGARPVCKETNNTMHSVEFDSSLNVNTNKNVDKILQSNITVSNRHVEDDRNVGDCTDDSTMLWNGNKYLDNIHLARLKVQSVAHVSNARFNEHNIQHKQIDTCEKRIRWTELSENAVNRNKDASLKVSIDLCRIQNLIDSKPELFANQTRKRCLQNDDDQRCRRKSRLSVQVNIAPQQARHYNAEGNDNSNYRRFRINDLQITSGTSNVEQTQVRNTLSDVNTFVSYQKPKHEIRYFDKCILDR